MLVGVLLFASIFISGCSSISLFTTAESETNTLVAQNYYKNNGRLIIQIEFKNADVFKVDNLLLLRKLTDLAWNIPSVNRVDSLANYQRIKLDKENILVSDMVYQDEKLSPGQAKQLKSEVLTEAAVLGYFLKDGNSANIYVDLKPLTDPETAKMQIAQIHQQVYAYIEKVKNNYPVNVEVSGGYYNEKPLRHGYYELPIAINAGLDVYDPAIIKDLTEITAWARNQKNIGFAFSITDIMSKLKEVSQPVLGNNKQTLTDEQKTRQLAMIYEMSLPYGLGIENLISKDRETLNLHLIFDNSDESLADQFLQQIQEKLQQVSEGRLRLISNVKMAQNVGA